MSTMTLGEVVKRIGESEDDRLRWLVEVVQRERKLTPGDQDNLALELVAFAIAGNPLPESYASHVAKYFDPMKHSVGPLEPHQVQRVLDRLRQVLCAVVRREQFMAVSEEGAGRRAFFQPTGRWIELPPEKLPIDELAARALDRLILQYGHFVKACPAPELRTTTGATCGRWFVASRPSQDYCSPRCQSRATTRAARKGTMTPAMQQARAREVNQKEVRKGLKRLLLDGGRKNTVRK